MDNTQSPEANTETPQPEVLKPRIDNEAANPEAAADSQPPSPQEPSKKTKRHTYRPSHRATFISLAVVIGILVINAAVLAFVLKRQSKIDNQANDQVTISQDVLDKLGVNRSSVSDAGVGLTIGPNTQFKNNVSIAGDANVSGQLQVNGKFTATDAALTQLKAGDTSLSKLGINGDLTASNVNLRNNLLVTGATRLQGAVTISNLLTVNNSLNVTGNVSIGGVFSAKSLASNSTLTVGGHIVTSGSTPGVSAGSAVGSNGTVSISGNDAAGTVTVNIGVGGGNGTLANISFHTGYTVSPSVIITIVKSGGCGVGAYYTINRNTNGFSIGASGLSAGCGYAFDYIVMQ